MNRSLAGFIVFGLILIGGFFAWQLNLYKQLEKTPLSCSGDKYINNSCDLGNACIILGQTGSTELFSIPTSSQDAINIINEFKKNNNTNGYCIPWVNLWLNIPMPKISTIEN